MCFIKKKLNDDKLKFYCFTLKNFLKFKVLPVFFLSNSRIFLPKLSNSGFFPVSRYSGNSGYCKSTLNVFLIKKNLWWHKIYLHNKFIVLNQNFTAWNVKIVKNSRFFKDFWSKFQVFPVFFRLNCQIPGFSRFPGFLATLN